MNVEAGLRRALRTLLLTQATDYSDYLPINGFKKIQRGWVDIHECSAMPSERVGG